MPRAPRIPRGTYIGGHDAARIVGLFPYGAGAADTYAHVVHGTKAQLGPTMLRGLLFEPGFAAWVAEQRGIKHERDVFLRDDSVPFFAGSVDAIEEGGEVAHEFTTTTSRSSHMWTGIPGTEDCAKHKWVQVQWYMGLDPAIREAHVWCFIVDANEEPLHYVVPRNEVAIEALRESSERFWYDHILARVPPLAGVHDAQANESLGVLYPRSNGQTIEAVPALVEAAGRYADARAAAKEFEDAKDVNAAVIKSLLGENGAARWEGGSVSWKERPLDPKVNWEQVAHEVALKANVGGELFNGIVREHTFQARSVRALRVNVSRKKGTP